MNASSYLEAFLAVYGWGMYYIFYLLFGMLGLFLYPLLRSVMEVLIEDLAGDSNRDGQLRRIGVSTGVMLLVFLLSMVPVVNLNMQTSQVADVCNPSGNSSKNVGEYNKLEAQNQSGYYMVNTSTRVPLLPYAMMYIAQGSNAVIRQKLPCVLDLTETQRSMYAIDTGSDPTGRALQNEYHRFHNECQVPIMALTQRIRDGEFDEAAISPAPRLKAKASEWFTQELNKAIKKENDWWVAWQSRFENQYNAFLNSADSPFIRDMIYNGRLNSHPALKDVPLAFNATNPVEGYPQDQALSCNDWWHGSASNQGLRTRLIQKMEKQAVLATALDNRNGVKECEFLDRHQVNDILRKGNNSASAQIVNSQLNGCYNALMQRVADGDANKLTASLLSSLMGQQVATSNLTDAQQTGMSALASGIIVGTIVQAKFGIDITGGIASTAIGFYANLLFLQMLMQFSLPFILMTVYMFWGIYMTVGAMTGSTLVKGLVLIYALNIIPGLWDIIRHLDDKLYAAMYRDNGSLWDRLLIDIASTIFYIAIIFVVFYLINLGGGGDASGAVKSSQNLNSDLSRGVAGSARKVAGTTGRVASNLGGRAMTGLGNWWRGRGG